MILKRTEFMARANVDENTLEMWLAEQWLLPIQTAEDEAFSDADLARAQLIQELRRDFGVNEAGVSVALHLLDQIHGLRAALQRGPFLKKGN
jgi:chaperone modulatory protein CbpM